MSKDDQSILDSLDAIPITKGQFNYLYVSQNDHSTDNTSRYQGTLYKVVGDTVHPENHLSTFDMDDCRKGIQFYMSRSDYNSQSDRFKSMAPITTNNIHTISPEVEANIKAMTNRIVDELYPRKGVQLSTIISLVVGLILLAVIIVLGSKL